MFKKQKELKRKTDEESKRKLGKLEKDMADEMSENMFNIINEEVKIIHTDEGGFNSGHLWKLKNKLRPKKGSTPTAMINKEGNLVTTSNDIKNATLEHFKTKKLK